MDFIGTKINLWPPQKKWIIFVPDSPTSSTFFTLFLILFLFKKKAPLIEAIAALTSFKYGIWAVAMIIWGALAKDHSLIHLITIQSITWIDVMLIISHLGMAFEAILYVKKYSFGITELLISGVWIIINDFVDYTQDVHPWLPESISQIDHVVGKYTLALSLFTFLLFFTLRRNKA